MKTILVVDDYTPFLEDVKKLMSTEGTQVFVAESAEEAIIQIQSCAFDIVITDLLLETQTADDGLAVLKAAKANPYTQVIVVTSYGSPELSVQSMLLGAFDYLQRGIPGSNFRAMLVSKVHLAFDYRAAKLACPQ